MVKVKQYPRISNGDRRDENYITFSKARTFDEDQKEIWETLKYHYSLRNIFDAFGGYKLLEARKATILGKLRKYFPVTHPRVATINVRRSEILDLDYIFQTMPLLVIDKIKSIHRSDMASQKEPINIELMTIVEKTQRMPYVSFCPSTVAKVTGRHRLRKTPTFPLKIKSNIRITMKAIPELNL